MRGPPPWWPRTTPCPGTHFEAAVEVTVTKWPVPCMVNTGSAAAIPCSTPAQVDIDHLVPVSKVALVKRGNGRDAGVGHERVESAELLDGGGNQLCEVLWSHNVNDACRGVSPVSGDACSDLAKRVLVSRPEHNPGALSGEQAPGSRRQSRRWPR